MVHSVISSRQINKDGSCYQSFLESILNVLSELQKLACCRFARSESGLLRNDGWFSNRGKPVENQAACRGGIAERLGGSSLHVLDLCRL